MPKNKIENEVKLSAIMPHFRDMFPQLGAVGESFVIKKIKHLPLTDCLFILSKLSRHWVKYQLFADSESNCDQIYRERCLELLSPRAKEALFWRENKLQRQYDIIFPELSVSHLIKICLKNCPRGFYTKEENFPRQTLELIGECLLVTNSIMSDNQMGSGVQGDFDEAVVGFTKQLIADEHFYFLQKLYQNYFLFNKFLSRQKHIYDAERLFVEKYEVSVAEYFAFLFVIYSQFVIKNVDEEDFEMPYLDLSQALSNLKPKFKNHLLENFLINRTNLKKVDMAFYNLTDLSKKPFIELENGVVIPLSLRRLLIGLTDTVYFDLLDSLRDEDQKKRFSEAYGYAVECYFLDIAHHIDKKMISEFEYNDGRNVKKTSDAILLQKNCAIFIECKKRQFHTLEFVKSGNKELFLERINEFFFKPLQQVCNRISDYRAGKYNLTGTVDKDIFIYPVVVYPLGPPLFSGGWDKMKLNELILPDLYKTDANIALPEFMDFAEFECIEAYLSRNPQTTLVDLINLKRSDPNHHNANWMVILHKHGFNYQNKRLQDEYLAQAESFKDMLFTVSP